MVANNCVQRLASCQCLVLLRGSAGLMRSLPFVDNLYRDRTMKPGLYWLQSILTCIQGSVTVLISAIYDRLMVDKYSK